MLSEVMGTDLVGSIVCVLIGDWASDWASERRRAATVAEREKARTGGCRRVDGEGRACREKKGAKGTLPLSGMSEVSSAEKAS